MKKKGVLLSAAVLLLSLFLGGCGTPMYELTDSEEEIIVHYAAYALAKHNTFQKDGMRVVPQELLEETEETEEPETQTDSETEDTESSQAPPQGGGSAEEGMGKAISLAEAVGYADILDITYEGYSLTGSYQEGKYFSLDADAGKTFLVMKFQVCNQSQTDAEVNVLSKRPTFRVSLDGGQWKNEEMTLLLNCLSTYEGTIRAGEKQEMVLLFQVSEEAAAQISNISLSVSQNGSTNPINL